MVSANPSKTCPQGLDRSPMPNLNKRFIDAQVVTQERQIHWDSGLRGFGLLILPSGVRSFVFDYRNADGRKRRVTIGRFGALTVDQAREQARILSGRVAKGDDPAATILSRRRAPTVSELLDDYLKKHVEMSNAPKTQKEVKSIVESRLRPALGALKVASVTRQDVLKLRRNMESTPRLANLTLATLSKAFNLAEEWAWRTDGSNPCRRVPRYEETPRERFLTAEELARVGAALIEAETAGLPWQDRDTPHARHRPKPENRKSLVNASALDVIRALLFTGARVSEIRELEWEHVDFAAETLALPTRKGGKRRPHPASRAAMQILKDRTRQKGVQWVFPSPTNSKVPLSISVVANAWERVRDRAGVADVRLHDLRHTAATMLSGDGANAFLLRDFLRHKTIAMTGRYANRDADPIRAAAESLARRIGLGLAGGAEIVKSAEQKKD